MGREGVKMERVRRKDGRSRKGEREKGKEESM